MHPVKIILIIVVTLILIGGTGYLYAANNIKSKPGYAFLEAPQGDSVNALFSISVGPSGVKPLRWLLEKLLENVEYSHKIPKQIINNLLQELQGLQLKVYEVSNNRHIFDTAIDDSTSALKEKHWQTLATIREQDTKVVVLQYGQGDNIMGLSVMASTSENALFLNLIGPFDLHAIAQRGDQ